MDRLTIPDEPIEGGMRRAVVDARAVKEQAMCRKCISQIPIFTVAQGAEKRLCRCGIAVHGVDSM